MRATSNFYNYATPNTVEELIRRNQGKTSKVLNAAKQILSHFFVALAGSSEPRIMQKVDAEGNLFWTVYDPVDGRSAHLYSESEVRHWIDQRYNY
ncbi:MAG TPA: hypothetical protein V6C88_18440 [Chroococcidiopsis sp.]